MLVELRTRHQALELCVLRSTHLAIAAIAAHATPRRAGEVASLMSMRAARLGRRRAVFAPYAICSSEDLDRLIVRLSFGLLAEAGFKTQSPESAEVDRPATAPIQAQP